MSTNKNTRSPLFERLKVGLEELEQWARGEKTLRVTEVAVPDPPPPYSPEHIRKIRLERGMSQAIFSRWLGVSDKTLQGWEQGTRKPSRSAARLLQVIEEPQSFLDFPARIGKPEYNKGGQKTRRGGPKRAHGHHD